MVNGYCFGGAFSIVESCDLAIAADEASFGLSEINFKGFPGGSVSKSLANLFRPRDALFYGLTGRRFDGQTAATHRLRQPSAVPLAKLRDETMAVARDIAAKDPAALKATKDGYRFSLEMTLGSVDELHRCQGRGARKLDSESAGRTTGVQDFVEGKFKPGLQSHETIKR